MAAGALLRNGKDYAHMLIGVLFLEFFSIVLGGIRIRNLAKKERGSLS